MTSDSGNKYDAGKPMFRLALEDMGEGFRKAFSYYTTDTWKDPRANVDLSEEQALLILFYPETGGTLLLAPTSAEIVRRLVQYAGGDLEALAALAEVVAYGANKYAPRGWRTVPNAGQRYAEALYRHAFAVVHLKEFVDAESGLAHWKHILWNCLTLLTLLPADTRNVYGD